MSLFESSLELKIPFHDLDPMNIVWHGNYIKYLEQARCEMFNELGYTYYDMKDDNYAYPIAKMSTKYIKPLSYNQEIIIKTFLEEIEPAMKIKYKMYNKTTQEKVFEAETMQIGVNIKTRQSIYEPPKNLQIKLGLADEK